MSSLKWELSFPIQWKTMLWLREVGASLLKELERRLVCMDGRDARKTQKAEFKRTLNSQLSVIEDDTKAVARRRSPRLAAATLRQLEDTRDVESVKSDFGRGRVGRGRNGKDSSDSGQPGKSRSRSVGRGSRSYDRATSNKTREHEDSETKYYTSEERSRSRSVGRGSRSNNRARFKSQDREDSETEYYTSRGDSESEESEVSKSDDGLSGKSISRRSGKKRPGQKSSGSSSTSETRSSAGHRLRDELGRFRSGGLGQSAERSRGVHLKRHSFRKTKVNDGASSAGRHRRVEKRTVDFLHNEGLTSHAHAGENSRRKRKNQVRDNQGEGGIGGSWDFDSRLKQLLGKSQEDAKGGNWDFDSRFNQLLSKKSQAEMAPRQEQQQMSNRQRNEDEMRQPRGYISEEIISPVSLLRSDRFVKNLQTAIPGPVQALEQEYIRAANDSAMFTDAEPRMQNRRDKKVLLQDPNSSSMLPGRAGSAPQKVRPDSRPGAKGKNVFDVASIKIQIGRNNTPAQQSNFESCSHEYRDEEILPPNYDAAMAETGKGSNQNLRDQMSQSPLFDTRISNEHSPEDFIQTPRKLTTASTTSKSDQQFQPSPMRPRRLSGLDMDAEEHTSHYHSEEPENSRELLSQSPLRASSAPSLRDQFQPSPLKSRPMTATSRGSSQMDTDSSSFDRQLHEHIRAFQAQQELSPPESRISNSPIMNRPGTGSEDWAKRQQLPDPSMVTPTKLAVDLNHLSLKSIDRLSQAVERMASTMEHSGNLKLSSDQKESGSEPSEARSRSASPTVFMRPLLRFDVNN